MLLPRVQETRHAVDTVHHHLVHLEGVPRPRLRDELGQRSVGPQDVLGAVHPLLGAAAVLLVQSHGVLGVIHRHVMGLLQIVSLRCA